MKRLRDMQFKEEIRSHLEWIWRLKEFIRGREILDRHIVAQDNQCPLGEWIHVEGQKYQHLDEYVELKNCTPNFTGGLLK
jgi:methyl-accepting chemotaxis protein